MEGKHKSIARRFFAGEKHPVFESGPAALQWKRLKRLNLVGARLEYLTRVTPIDRLLAKIALPLLPRSFSPNRITVFRFIATPIVAALLLSGFAVSGMILFLLAAFSDALDGALARTKSRITKWGIVADPIADKLLIGTAALIVVWQSISPALALALVAVELVLALSAYLRYSGRLMPAKAIGKIKMVLECVGVGFALLFGVFSLPIFLLLARYFLYAALAFALLSLFVYRSI